MPTQDPQTVVPPLAATQEPEQKPSDDRPVAIPVDDFTFRVQEVDQHGALARQAMSDAIAREQQRLPEGRPNAFQGPTRFHDLPDRIAQEIYDYAESENRARRITTDIMQARSQDSVKPYTPPPVPVAIAEQTRLEMEAGRAAVARHAERAVQHPRPKADPAGSVAVFRPEDYVPDAKKGQGLIPSVTARGQNL